MWRRLLYTWVVRNITQRLTPNGWMKLLPRRIITRAIQSTCVYTHTPPELGGSPALLVNRGEMMEVYLTL